MLVRLPPVPPRLTPPPVLVVPPVPVVVPMPPVPANGFFPTLPAVLPSTDEDTPRDDRVSPTDNPTVGNSAERAISTVAAASRYCASNCLTVWFDTTTCRSNRLSSGSW